MYPCDRRPDNGCAAPWRVGLMLLAGYEKKAERLVTSTVVTRSSRSKFVRTCKTFPILDYQNCLRKSTRRGNCRTRPRALGVP